jgi:hypothetical protein
MHETLCGTRIEDGAMVVPPQHGSVECKKCLAQLKAEGADVARLRIEAVSWRKRARAQGARQQSWTITHACEVKAVTALCGAVVGSESVSRGEGEVECRLCLTALPTGLGSFECSWCGAGCLGQIRSRAGETFCSIAHRDASSRAVKRLRERLD